MPEHELHAVAQSGWVILVRDGDCFVEVDRLEAFLLPEIIVELAQVRLAAQLSFDELDQLCVFTADLLLCFWSRGTLYTKRCIVPLFSQVFLDLVHLRLGGPVHQVFGTGACPPTPHRTTTHMRLSRAADR